MSDIKVVVVQAAHRLSDLPAYPDPASNYYTMLDDLTIFQARAQEHFPQMQALYVLPRSYGGFKGHEPMVYEEGHAINTWLATETSGAWKGWLAYIWAGECPLVNASGVCYVESDYSDGIHPSSSGLDKIVPMVHKGFMDEGWFRR